FSNLAAGSYDVLVTWTGHDSHASDARFTVVLQQFDATGSLVQVAQSVRINQRLTPNGPSFGGRSWQSLGVFASEGAPLKVQLTATDGNAGDHVLYTAFSDNPNVSVTVTGNKLQVTAAANFIGTARITVAGQDGPSGPGDWRGRKAEQTFDLNVGVSAVTGSK